MADEREIPKIRTMRSDAEELIKEKQVSQLDLATKQYVSQKRAGSTIAIATGHFLKKSVIYLIIILFLGSGGYFGYRMWIERGDEDGVVAEAPKPFSAITAADDKKIITFREALPGELISKIKEEKRRSLRFGTIIYYPLEMDQKIGGKKFINSGDLIKTLSWNPGNVFLENILPEFNTLIAYTDKSNDFSVIFKVRDFPRAIASMIEWERSIAQDFKSFLDAESIENISQFIFQDEVIKNNDSRVLKNSTAMGGGKIILAYAIFNKQFLVISTSREGLALVLDRLIKLPPRD